jgi:cardiolipin synthase
VNSRFRASVRDGNRFMLLGGGDEFFSRMLQAIDGAKRYVLAEFYLVESGEVMNRFIAALTHAASRGVRVCALFDAVGARGLKESDRTQLRTRHVDLVFFNAASWRAWPYLFLRDHRKLLIVDGTAGFTGGTGLADMFSPDVQPDGYWQDCVVEIEGPVLEDWHKLFASTWERSSRRPLNVPPRASQSVIPGELGCVSATAGLGANEVERSVISRIRKASGRVWIATAYFWPSGRLRRALRRAARRGVDVRLQLAGPHTDAPAARAAGRLFYTRLLASGVTIYEYQPRFLHAKVILCDDWVSIGSSNLDRWGVLWNLDANQEVDSHAFATQVEALFMQTFGASLILRTASDVVHHWSVRFWRLVARAILAWSARAVSRLRR